MSNRSFFAFSDWPFNFDFIRGIHNVMHVMHVIYVVYMPLCAACECDARECIFQLLGNVVGDSGRAEVW